jgi:hypothetical protein
VLPGAELGAALLFRPGDDVPAVLILGTGDHLLRAAAMLPDAVLSDALLPDVIARSLRAGGARGDDAAARGGRSSTCTAVDASAGRALRAACRGATGISLPAASSRCG